jgi:hypothetical protein
MSDFRFQISGELALSLSKSDIRHPKSGVALS